MTTWHDIASCVEPAAPAKHVPRLLFLDFFKFPKYFHSAPVVGNRQCTSPILSTAGKCKNLLKNLALFGVVVKALHFPKPDTSAKGSCLAQRKFFFVLFKIAWQKKKKILMLSLLSTTKALLPDCSLLPPYRKTNQEIDLFLGPRTRQPGRILPSSSPPLFARLP